MASTDEVINNWKEAMDLRTRKGDGFGPLSLRAWTAATYGIYSHEYQSLSNYLDSAEGQYWKQTCFRGKEWVVA